MKRIKPSDQHARPNQIIQIQKVIRIKPPASVDKGAFQYLKRQPTPRQLKVLVGKGMYLGDINQVSAFVWLPDESEI